MLPAILDRSAAESLRAELCDILKRRPARISVDFGQVTDLTVAGMSLLLSFAREAKGMQPVAVLEARRVAPPIQSLLRVVGLDSVLAPSV